MADYAHANPPYEPPAHTRERPKRHRCPQIGNFVLDMCPVFCYGQIISPLKDGPGRHTRAQGRVRRLRAGL